MVWAILARVAPLVSGSAVSSGAVVGSTLTRVSSVLSLVKSGVVKNAGNIVSWLIPGYVVGKTAGSVSSGVSSSSSAGGVPWIPLLFISGLLWFKDRKDGRRSSGGISL